MAPSLRVAVVGLGDIAVKAHLPLLASWPGLDLVLYSRRAETVERVRAQYRLPAGTSDWSSLLAARPDAAFVLSPSDTHAALVRELLAAGVDVFVEKPATLQSAETRGLAEQADALGRVLMVGFNRRYAPLHVKAKELWGDRPIGQCLVAKHRAGAAHVDLFSNYIDDTIHVIDLLRFFAGEARAVRTTARLRNGRLLGAVSLAALDGGGQGLVTTSLEAGAWSESYVLHGGGATLEIEAFSRLRFVSGGEERVIAEAAGGWGSRLEARGFSQQIAHFFECVGSRRAPLTSAWEALRTQELLEDMVAVAG